MKSLLCALLRCKVFFELAFQPTDLLVIGADQAKRSLQIPDALVCKRSFGGMSRVTRNESTFVTGLSRVSNEFLMIFFSFLIFKADMNSLYMCVQSLLFVIFHRATLSWQC